MIGAIAMASTATAGQYPSKMGNPAGSETIIARRNRSDPPGIVSYPRQPFGGLRLAITQFVSSLMPPVPQGPKYSALTARQATGSPVTPAGTPVATYAPITRPGNWYEMSGSRLGIRNL